MRSKTFGNQSLQALQDTNSVNHIPDSYRVHHQIQCKNLAHIPAIGQKIIKSWQPKEKQLNTRKIIIAGLSSLIH